MIRYFPTGVYYGNVTENGTAGMMVMTMTATDYDDLDEGTNAKLKYSIGRSCDIQTTVLAHRHLQKIATILISFPKRITYCLFLHRWKIPIFVL
jgi:hypothetical protein